MTEQILPYLEQLQKNGLTAQKDSLRVTVLFSGDTGFYSGCRKLYVALQEAVAVGVLNAGVRSCREFLPWPHWRPEWEKVMKMRPF